MMGSSFRGIVLPSIIFPALTALAYNTLFGRLKAAGVGGPLTISCRPHNPYPPIYFGVAAVDDALCPLVNFFSFMMQSESSFSVLKYALGTGGPLVLIPLFEATRKAQHPLLKFPALWLLVSQVASVGATLPLYWLVFILTGGPSKTRITSTSEHSQAVAQSLAFGFIFGAALPSIAMLAFDDPIVTAIWQFYPIYIAVAQFFHQYFDVGDPKPGNPGKLVDRIMFIATFLISSSVHMSATLPRIFDGEFSNLKAVIIPSLEPVAHWHLVSTHLSDFLKWDVSIAFMSTAVATLWWAESFRQCLRIAIWYVMAVPVFGFGAAVTAVAIWRNELH